MVNSAWIPVILAVAAAWHLFMLHLSPIIGLSKPNFRQEIIPASYGIAMLGYILCGLASISIIWPDLSKQTLVISITAALMCILGWIDDIFGSRDASGFRGHFRMLFSGKITTGAVKAIGGGLCGLIIGYVLSDGSVIVWILTSLLIPLGANTINLLDLRPGRACGAVLAGLLLICPFTVFKDSTAICFLIFAVVLCFALLDGRAKAMMGDSGSNQLGAVLGVCGALYAPLYLQIALIIFMLWIQIYSEKHSITALIDRNPMLNRIDRILGVR